MYYGNIKKSDIANGTGVRVTLFVSGCTHHCKGCFNEETWDFNYGQPFTRETEDMIISYLKPDYVTGLTVLGGEPMEYVNQQALLPFLKRVKETYPDKSIWVYTGYLFEEDVLGRMAAKWTFTREILELIDVLVDGPFVEEEKDISLVFRGSANQRIIDVAASLKEGRTVLHQLPD
ncbi:MAG: anaerobic ribonucleoside-triphosphate reductase activating protein [Eubacterium sp.]|nr:anaerobic ribonucleoside-triphosphate reductase activating protein [Eubacterium sp.]